MHQPQTQPVAAASERAAILALGLAALLVALDSLIVAPILPLVAREFGSSLGGAGALVGAYLVPYGVGQLAYGLLSDRFGKLRVIRAVFAAFALAVGVCGLARSLPQLTALRMLAGLFAGVVVPTGNAYVGDVVPYHRRQTALAAFVSFYSLGMGVSVALGGLAGSLLSWRVLFFAYGIVAAGVTAFLYRLPGDGGRPLRLGEGLLSYLRLLRSLPYLVLLLFGAGEGVALFTVFSFLGAYAKAVPGRPLWLVGLLLAPIGIVPLAGRPLVPALHRHGLDERAVAAAGFAAGALGYLLLWLAPASDWAFAAGTGLIGLCFLIAHTAVLAATSEVGAAARGRAMSLWGFCLFVAGGLAAEVLRRSIDGRGFGAVLATGLVGMLLLAAVARAALPRPGHR